MASPAVVGSPVESSTPTAGTTHTISLPDGAVGNMIVIVISKGTPATTTTFNALTGWTELLDESVSLGLAVLYRVCDGTEGASISLISAASIRTASIAYEVSGVIDPATQAPEIGTTATGSSTTPDPPSVSVTGGAKDILTIAFFGRSGEEADDDTWVTAAPSGFGTLTQKACGVAGTNLAGMVASAHLASNTATSNPGTFTAATGAWRAQTVVLHPAPAVHNIAAALDITPTLAAALGRETFVAANLDLSLTIAVALSRETFLAASLDVSPVIAVNLTVAPGGPTEHLIAAALPIDLQMAAALTRETFIAAALPLDMTVNVAITRETFIAAALDISPTIAIQLVQELLIAANFPLGMAVTVNIVVEGQAGETSYRMLLGAG